MINYRELFNPSYNYIGIIIIITLVLLIILLNRNFQKSFQQIGTVTLTASILMLGLSLFIKLLVNQMIPYQYKLFIEVISENFFQYSLTLSTVGIAIGVLFIATAKFFFTNQNKKIPISS